MQASCNNIAGMVSVNECRYNYQVSPWFGHDRWQFFSDVTIKVHPVSIGMKERFINVRGMQILGKFTHVLMFLEIGEDMIYCLQISELWICLDCDNNEVLR